MKGSKEVTKWKAGDGVREKERRQYLEESESAKVEVEELESLLGPDDSEVNFRRIMREARDDRGRKIFGIFETSSSNDLSSFLVAKWSRWDKYKRAPWRQDSSASARE